ncbi:hypothetical protein [uncultured Amphritea sp.]|uniref:hypothetical protein n=1 Tax=uncultured Amphritea sp. TaxID=981605 RepID=UPI002637FCCF|nr:hypothetical protein [uncultured Amphritea sp.]
MKHAESTTLPLTATRLTQWWLALLLLLVLIVMQSRVLPLETLAKQLLSVNESNAEQFLLPAPVDDEDQPCDIVLSTAPHYALLSPDSIRVYSEKSPLPSTRWVTPSPRAPPTFG